MQSVFEIITFFFLVANKTDGCIEIRISSYEQENINFVKKKTKKCLKYLLIVVIIIICHHVHEIIKQR